MTDAILDMKAHDTTTIAHVAHELRAPLSLINGSLDALEQYSMAMARYVSAANREVPLTAQREELRLAYVMENLPSVLEICREGAQRLTYVVEQLRAFGRRAADTPHAKVSVKAVVLSALRAVRTSAPRAPEVEVAGIADVFAVGEEAALVQVCINLLQNAFDAVADVPQPCVWVEAQRDDSGNSTQANGQIVVRVRDNGPGIPAAVAQRMFEPFFTTKSYHAGLGLGLAIVRQIVQDQGGSIELTSSVPGNTEITVCLPAAGCATNLRGDKLPGSARSRARLHGACEDTVAAAVRPWSPDGNQQK